VPQTQPQLLRLLSKVAAWHRVDPGAPQELDHQETAAAIDTLIRIVSDQAEEIVRLQSYAGEFAQSAAQTLSKQCPVGHGNTSWLAYLAQGGGDCPICLHGEIARLRTELDAVPPLVLTEEV
jgi:hypothetical protein